MRYSTALTMLVFPISQVYWEDVCACMCARTCMHAYVQSCLTLCDPMGCSPPGSSVHGILQAGIPEWAAISSSRRSSWPRKWTHISCLLHCRQILYTLVYVSGFHFFLLPSTIPLCGHIKNCLFTHQLMDSGVLSWFGLLGKMLLGTFVNKSSFGHKILFLLRRYLEYNRWVIS